MNLSVKVWDKECLVCCTSLTDGRGEEKVGSQTYRIGRERKMVGFSNLSRSQKKEDISDARK